MNTAIANSNGHALEPVSSDTLSAVLLQGDLKSLTNAQRVEYMGGVCKSLGLNPLTKPFDFISLNGKLVMYAKKDCTEQLRKIHGVSVHIKARESFQDCYVVTAQARDRDGREDESIGVVPIHNLKGEALANAMMKAETKAKRRATLSICGLGLLDETELEAVAAESEAPRVAGVEVTGATTQTRAEQRAANDAALAEGKGVPNPFIGKVESTRFVTSGKNDAGVEWKLWAAMVGGNEFYTASEDHLAELEAAAAQGLSVEIVHKLSKKNSRYIEEVSTIA